jgi:hypothetical protein
LAMGLPYSSLTTAYAKGRVKHHEAYMR